MRTLSRSRYRDTLDASKVHILDIYNNQYQRLMSFEEIDQLTTDNIARILRSQADKIVTAYENNVVCRYEKKYVVLYVTVLRPEKHKIHRIYQGAGSRNYK